MPNQANQPDPGADSPLEPTAHAVQRKYARTGDYQCQKCKNTFHFIAGGEVSCTRCKNKSAESIIALYIEDDPASVK